MPRILLVDDERVRSVVARVLERAGYDVECARQFGASRTLAKPFTGAELLAVVDQVLAPAARRVTPSADPRTNFRSACVRPFINAPLSALRTFSVLAVLIASVMSEPASAQMKPDELAQVSLEDLMRIEIIAAGRKEQRADSVAAAAFVLTADDIRRSGMRTLPDVLRLVPGVQVAQVNSSRWAVSVRGFNSLYANKLLVLIDGRSLYNRAFSGVFWDGQDVLLEDVARIEVIRGPGGAVWGANAVNGVINIVTKTAAETRGGLVTVGTGTMERGSAAARYGGALGRASYRLSSQWTSRGESLIDRSTEANDNWAVLTTGGRIDWERGQNSLTLDGSFLANRNRALWMTLADPSPAVASLTHDVSSTQEAAVLARWIRTRANGASLQVQTFVTDRRADLADVHATERVADLDIQYHAGLGGGHDVVFGGGHRRSSVEIDGSFTYTLHPSRNPGRVTNLFVQDEVTLTPALRVTLGSKVEHERVTGWSVQPSARAIWDVARGQHVWVAASRAVRTPSAADLGIRVNTAAVAGADGTPILIGVVGNPAYRTEKFTDVEAGYRVEIGAHAAVDVTAFRGRYRDLQTAEPMAPMFELLPAPAHVFLGNRFGNLLEVDTRGFEVATHWIPVSWWRLDGSYSALTLVPHLDAASADPVAARFDGSAPRSQWQLQSTGSLGARIQLSGSVFHTGRLRELNVPAYTRADLRLEGKLTDRLSVIASGQNLQARAHAEFAGAAGVLPTLVPRAVGLQLVWRHR